MISPLFSKGCLPGKFLIASIYGMMISDVVARFRGISSNLVNVLEKINEYPMREAVRYKRSNKKWTASEFQV